MQEIKMIYNNEQTTEGKCKRCGRTTTLLSNGYCMRCDSVLFDHKEDTHNVPVPYRPYKNDPIRFPHPKRRHLWC